VNYFQLKTLLAVLLVSAGLAAAFSMFTLMGRSEKRLSPGALRRTHTVAGYTFYALLVILTIMGLQHLGIAGDNLPLRGVIHWVLASVLVFLLLLKLAVVLFFRQFLKLVPVIGMAAITLTLVVVTVSAVFFAVTGKLTTDREGSDTLGEVITAPGEALIAPDEGKARRGETEVTGEQASVSRASREPVDAEEASIERALAERGDEIFHEYCADCHHTDTERWKTGPGLLGLFDRESLEVNGRDVTVESVREQIVSPDGVMPAFGNTLSGQELDALLAYLQAL
jgi:mono/diheme cytochrome c family protein